MPKIGHANNMKSSSGHALGWVAVGWAIVGWAGCTSASEPGGSEPGDSEPLSAEAVQIVAVQGGWLVPTQITKADQSQAKLYVAIAKEDVEVGKASVEGATMADLESGKNPFGHPEGYYRIQHHSRLPLAQDQRVRVFVSESRDMQDATMFTLLPDPTATASGGFYSEQGLEYSTNASHQLGVGLGTNEAKKAALLVSIQDKYDHIASVEGLPPVRLHYELDIGILARIGFNANDPLTGTLNRNQPILVADRLRTLLAAEMVEFEDPDFTTCKPCNGTVPGEETPDPTTDENPTDDPSTPVLY